jgi:hypothetical protein
MKYVKLTNSGYLPAGTEVDEVVKRGDERELLAVRDTYRWRQTCTEMLQKGDPEPDLWKPDLAETAPVSPRQALAATQRLADLLTGRRWHLMRDAREAGDSWTQIGDALGMTKQGATEWYKRRIDEQEKFIPEYHDAVRSRAVLDEDTPAQ